MEHVEVDHVFVFSTPQALEADELLAAGFSEGSANTHAGQGTACRRFFFDNCMLEFLYVTDLDVTRSGTAEPTGLAERWAGRSSGGSPFGICFRPQSGDYVPPPFPTWTYGPAYLPGGTPSYEISRRCKRVEEPFLFYMPMHSRPDRYPGPRRQPLDHPCGARAVTRIRLESPLAELPDLRYPLMASAIEAGKGPLHHMHVELDHGRQFGSLVLRTLPLSLSW